MAELGVILGFWEAAAGPARGRASRLLAAAGEADPLGLTLGQAACRLIELRSRLIGDSLTSDMRGGADYGIDTCWYNPLGEARPDDLQLTYEIAHLRELLEMLE